MSSKGGRNKRTQNVRNLDERVDAPSLDQSIIDKRLDIIPVGRQLERTPPSKTERVSYQINKADDSRTSEHQLIKEEPCTQETTTSISCNGSSDVTEDRKSIRRSNSSYASAMTGNADPEIFIQGMQGYQWTDTDLEFVYQTKLKKQVQQLEQELRDVHKSVKSTRQLRDVAVAGHDKIQAELSKVSSCERVQEMSEEILLKSQSSKQLDGLDLKGLLARLKVTDVQRFTSEERKNISKLNAEVKKAQAMREKQKELTRDIDVCKVKIEQIKVNMHTLTADIVALDYQLEAKEGALLSAKPRQRVPKSTKTTSATKHPTAPSVPKPSTVPKPPIVPKSPIVPKPPSVPKPSSAPKASTVPKPPSAPKASTVPKPPSAPKASTVPKPPSAPKASTVPKPSSAPKASTVPKPPSAPKASTVPKPSSAPKASTVPKPPSAPKASTVPKPPSAPKASTVPKPPSAPKASAVPKPPSAPKASAVPKPPNAPKASTVPKPPSAPKASAVPKPPSAPKATKALNVLERDVDGLRRSKRIAAKKEK